MGLQVVYRKSSHEPAVRALNARMRAADALLFPLPETAPSQNPNTPAPGIEFCHFVVVDDGGVVRGGYFIRSQPCYIRGQVHSVGHYNTPLSEGIIDKRYAAVGAMMLTRALRERYGRHSIQEFSEWADHIWLESAPQYSLSAVWSADYLRFIYPHPDPHFCGVPLTEGDAPAGWVQMLDCQLRDRSYFGEMRVAALVDGAGTPEAIPSLVHSGVEAARERNADVVVSNQMHGDWTSAPKAAGFWRGPSNYLLAMSKELRKLLEPLEEAVPRIHFNRGDGDGRVNLIDQP